MADPIQNRCIPLCIASNHKGPNMFLSLLCLSRPYIRKGRWLRKTIIKHWIFSFQITSVRRMKFFVADPMWFLVMVHTLRHMSLNRAHILDHLDILITSGRPFIHHTINIIDQ